MARLIFAANDPGAARVLEASIGMARSRGHDLTFVGAGPAIEIWRRAGEEVATEMPDDGGDVLLTGTGFSPFESGCWAWAAAVGVPSLAVVEAWTNFERRFVDPACKAMGAEAAQPDAIAVIDEASRLTIEAEGWGRARLFVVGQPHLQAQTARLTEARRRTKRTPHHPTLVFFSEPIDSDFGREVRGFDQFEVFEYVADAVSRLADVRLLVKPHPRESVECWRQLAELAGDQETDDLLVSADGVIGITTMVLVEAHLLGVPVLSVQPNRRGVANLVVERLGAVVIEPAAVVSRLAEFVDNLDRVAAIDEAFVGCLEDADRRLIDAVEKMLICH